MKAANKKQQSKLAKLPTKPGVYFHKDKTGEIIYIGKAANLRNRVRQYYQRSRVHDPKTDRLIGEIVDTDWTELETEVDALFLEAELVRRYLPRYNILLRDDKSLQYVRIDYKSDYPTVNLVRRPLDDGAEYFGPYVNGFAVKKALRYLRRAFPYAISKPVNQKRASLYYHLGLDPGIEDGRTSLGQYRANLRKLMQYLRGERKSLMKQIERDMKQVAKVKDFEQAARLRNQLFSLQALSRQVLFGDREIQDTSRDQALIELAKLLGLKKPPRRIEGFDISHISGTDTTASMVVFTDGLPEKAAYRKFKMRRPGNDDFAHIFEALSRRFSQTNVKKWGQPDLILIDGGKGQLSAALAARDQAGYGVIPTIGLAKRFEDLIIKQPDGQFEAVHLGQDSHLVKLLQRIRDESHRFAVSYHSTLRRTRQTASLLDEVPGVGPLTRKKLIKHFGSARNVLNAPAVEIQKLLGAKTGARVAHRLKALK
ncbi:excinuclease ABC subunit UvrC [Candidatus Saccharibacteria bacterium]|nr:excinuclease ABC subunit UvrC [Candidatus Saccharibacteria bacterium]MBI2285574.1 excinuclease ABC subunit UvrC [Candidatus Saccharibacteria bacterium]